MNTLLDNILYRFRYHLSVAAVILIAVVCGVWLYRKSEQTLQKEVALHAEQEGLRLEEAKRLAKIQEAERQKQFLEKTEADLKAYKGRYLTSHDAHYSLAILIAKETGEPNEPLGHAVSTSLNTNGLTTTTSLFSPEFITDGLLSQTLAGSKEVFDKLELTNVTQSVLLARQSVEYSTNSALDGVITAHMMLDMSTFSTSTFQLLSADNISASGAGLNRLEARAMAQERILKQLGGGRFERIQKSILSQSK